MSINNINSLILSNLLSSNVASGNQVSTSSKSRSFDSTLNSLLSSENTLNNSTVDASSLYSLFSGSSSNSGLMSGSSLDMAMFSLLNAVSRNQQNYVANNTYNTNSKCNHCCNHKEENNSNDISNVIQSTISSATSSTISNISNNSPQTIGNISTSNTSKASKVVEMAKSFIGTPYVWGANGPKSFDCSGFSKYIYKQVYGKDIPRVSYDQAKTGTKVEKKDLQPGDLVFFDTMNKGRVSHVGIYIGDGKFVHAANSKKGVIESDLNSSYYTKTYRGARRP